MYIEKNSLDELLSRVRISEIVSQVTKLKRTGQEFSGLCPFHKEKTPSFTVNDSKGLYHCFGCKESGNVIKFVESFHSMNFVDAVKFIADQAGFQLQFREGNQVSEKSEMINDLRGILQEAMRLYEQQLKENSFAREYLKSRKISSGLAKEFNLGYSPDDGFFLLSKMGKASKDLLIRSGLLIDSNESVYDRFRGRIMFPIFDAFGQIMAFGGRNIINDGKMRAKYINSPSTEIFQKGNELYAFNVASKEARKKDRMIVTEGYMDVISLHKAGFKESVANLGTAITENHLAKLWKVTNEPIICLDGDEAGLRAMSKVAHSAMPMLQSGRSLSFIIMPKSIDPDDLINRNGAEAFEDLIKSSIPLSEMIWRFELSSHKCATPEQKAKLKRDLYDLAGKISDKNVRYNYINFFNVKIKEKFANKFNWQSKEVASADIKITKSQNLSLKIRYLYALISLIIEHQSLLNDNEIMDSFLRIETEGLNSHENEQEILSIRDLRNLILVSFEENPEEKIKDILLKKHHLEKEVEMLCGESSMFLDQFNKKSLEVSKLTWFILNKKYNIEVLKEERQMRLNELTEKSNEIANNLDGDIKNLHNEILELQETLYENKMN